MASKNLIDKLVKMVEKDKLLEKQKYHDSEDRPLEFYELREFAKKRVLLKKTYKIHLLVYLIINGFLFYINWRELEDPRSSILHFWAYFPLIIWGIFLWVHGIYMVTNNVRFLMGTSLQKKIFIIVSLTMLYLALLTPFINHLINYYSDSSGMWWHYVDILIGVFVIVYWYAIREIDEDKLQEKLDEEIDKIRVEYEVHKEKEQNREQKTQRKNKRRNENLN